MLHSYSIQLVPLVTAKLYNGEYQWDGNEWNNFGKMMKIIVVQRQWY